MAVAAAEGTGRERTSSPGSRYDRPPWHGDTPWTSVPHARSGSIVRDHPCPASGARDSWTLALSWVARRPSFRSAPESPRSRHRSRPSARNRSYERYRIRRLYRIFETVREPPAREFYLSNFRRISLSSGLTAPSGSWRLRILWPRRLLRSRLGSELHPDLAVRSPYEQNQSS